MPHKSGYGPEMFIKKVQKKKGAAKPGDKKGKRVK